MATGTETCPICSSPLSHGPKQVRPYTDVDMFSCTRCGGYYLSGLLRTRLPSLGAADRLALSRFIRFHNDRTGEPYREPLIPGTYQAAMGAGRPPAGPAAQMDALLVLVADRTSNLGDQTEPESGLVWAARLGLPSGGHFDSLANAARDRGLLDHAMRVGSTHGHVLSLTMPGWERVGVLRDAAGAGGGQRGGDLGIRAGDGGPHGQRGGDIVIRAGDGGPGARGGDIGIRAGDGAPAVAPMAIEPEKLHPSLTTQALHLMAAASRADSGTAGTSQPTAPSTSGAVHQTGSSVESGHFDIDFDEDGEPMAIPAEWRTEPDVSAGPVDPETPSPAQREIINLVARFQLAAGEPLEGRAIRGHFDGIPSEKVDEVLRSCVPTWLSWSPNVYPPDRYGLTLDGVLCSPEATRAALLIEAVLGVLRVLVKRPGHQEWQWSDVCSREPRIDSVHDLVFARTVLLLSGLAGDGSLENGWSLPVDAERIARYEDVSAFATFRRQRVAESRPSPRSAVPSTSASSFVASRSAPKAFISYSWDSDAHKAWVKSLAECLRRDGVDVVLDQWHLGFGDQIPQFMESSVRDSDYVILVCTPRFKAKADGRKGGVGYEGHIITAEVFRGAPARKFVPVLRHGEWDEAAPSWLAGKLAADLRGDPHADQEYRRLLEHFHDDREPAPPVGNYTRRNPTPDPQ